MEKCTEKQRDSSHATLGAVLTIQLDNIQLGGELEKNSFGN